MRKKNWFWGSVFFCLASTLAFSTHAADLQMIQDNQDNSDASAPANPPASSSSGQNDNASPDSGYGDVYDDQGQPVPDQDAGPPDQSIDNNNANTDDE